MKLRMALFGLAIVAAGCTTTPKDPTLQTAGPPPVDVESIVRAEMRRSIRDYDRLEDIDISRPKEGGRWTGLINNGKIPNWYVCVNFKRKIFLRGRLDQGPFIVWIRNNRVTGVTHYTDDDFSDHDCRGRFQLFGD